MELKEFLEFAAAGAIITTGGSLLALFIKDFVFTTYFENRREKKSLDTIYKKYKDPITLSAIEVSSRLIEIHSFYPTVFLNEEVLKLKASSLSKNSTEDEHFRKHKLISTIYRLCSFFGWLELYRQEITFLNSSNNRKNRKLEKCFQNIRSVFADGQLNKEKNWTQWVDFLIFREEQRAIGESMIVINDKIKSIMGFVKFKLLIKQFAETGESDWLMPAFNFFLNPSTEKDFRKTRYLLLLSHFQELLEILDKKLSKESIEKIKNHISSVSK